MNDLLSQPPLTQPSNATLLEELRKIHEVVGKLHKRLKNTEDTITDMQSDLNFLSEKKKSKSITPTKEVRVSTYVAI